MYALSFSTCSRILSPDVPLTAPFFDTWKLALARFFSRRGQRALCFYCEAKLRMDMQKS